MNAESRSAKVDLSVRRTVSSGEVVELGKTAGSRRQVPSRQRSLAALDAIPARLDTADFRAPRGYAGLVARMVEPMAPNLAALRRVSSNVERA